MAVYFLGCTAEKEFNKHNRVDSEVIRPGTSTEAAWVDTETWAYQLPAGMCSMSTLCVHTCLLSINRRHRQ